MTNGAKVFAGFLYGVNIPGGVWWKAAEVEAKLRASLPGLMDVKCIGDADNLLLEIATGTDREIASRLEVALGVKGAVVVSLDDLRQTYDVARRMLNVRGFPEVAPFVVTIDDAEWEFGIVLSSVELPGGALFLPTKNARALEVVEPRALLVQKRRVTATGSRIMWGGTVIKPLVAQLRRGNSLVGCLTSRALGRIGDVIAAAGNR